MLPALVIGLLIAAYWARVLRLAYKARRRTGRAANFIPTELLGRLLRVIWFPTVFAWITLPFVTALRHLPRALRPAYDSPIIAWCALIVACAAFAATLVCWKRMGKSWRMGIDPAEKTQLVVTGPYAVVRHPIYALSCLLMLSTLATVPSPAMAFVALTHILLLLWESHREERHLFSVHGHKYHDYASRVGRFVPTLSRRHLQSP